MCWVAIDRGLELADRGGFDAPTERWEEVREELRSAIFDRGFGGTIDEHGSFTQAFDDALNAAGLLIPLLGFVEWDDLRAQGTIDDGLPGEEGAFVLRSFWLVDALSLSGRIDEARDLFETLVEYASPLVLLSEGIDPETGAAARELPLSV